MMRLFAVIDSFGLGGAETQLSAVLNRLADERGRECLACSVLPPRLIEVPFSHRVQRLYLGKRTRWSLPIALARLRTALASFRPRVVYSRLPLANGLARLATGMVRPRIRHIAGIDTAPEMYTPAYSLSHPGNILFRRLERHADLILCNSRGTRDAVAQRGYPEPRLRILPNGIDTDFYRPPAALLPESPFRLVTVASLRPEKGVPTLVTWLGTWLREHAARLDVIGDGEDRATVERLVAHLGIGDLVTLHGAVRDVRPILHRSHLFVSTASVEGFGIAVAEAAACGIPTVALDVPGGLRDVIRTGHTGYLVPPAAAVEFRERITELQRDPQRRTAMGIAARAHVAGTFALTGVLDTLEQFLDGG